MAKKKKKETIGMIDALELIKKSRPMQDIPFRTGVYTDKRKNRIKVTKRNMDKFM